ncbi:MAG: sugar ABC transporter substrate-binding protein [Planctomycetes bacterium GWF2_42_9]|nr:MAG: sugar ABC transporter substrate-binding protein [Planctomycetes bacterium GWF2_42_9]HAL45405.1 sugar ABC transporter substrate-binding protein [Phycisphaerales bacterium]
MRKTFLCLLLIAISFSFISCKKSPDADKSKITIAVIPKGTTHEFWKSIHAGAIKAAQELDVEIIWKGPLKEDDRESQITVVEDFITRGVSGIVLAPLDNTALRRPVSEATRSGIKVVIIDSALDSNDQISYVSTDNYVGGQKAGEYMAKLLNFKGKIAMLRYQEGSASTQQREKGFLDAIAKYPDIKVVSDNQYGGATTETAYKASENLLAPLRGTDQSLTIDGVFTPNESTTFGMLRALQDNSFAGKVKFVGFDNSEMLVKALKEGQINALILQDAMNMGYLGVKTMVAYLRNQPIEKQIDTGSVIATPENMNDPQISNLLNPDFKQWLTTK